MAAAAVVAGGLERHAALSRSSAELDGVIRSLEEENRALQFEFERLRTGGTPAHIFQGLSPMMGGTLPPAHLLPTAASVPPQQPQQQPQPPPAQLEPQSLVATLPGPAGPPPVPAHLARSSSPRMEEMVTEARLLRQHKGRLEARMTVLEDHNRQLETQLSRLRLLLQQQQTPSGVGSLLHPHHAHHHPTSSSSTSEAELYTSLQYAHTRRHHSLHRYGAAGPPPVPRHQRAASETAGSLSEGEVDDILLGGSRLRHLEMADSCPTVPYAVNRSASSSLGSLFHMAGQVGRAVGQLVTVMTDDFAADPAIARHEAPPSSPLLNHSQPPVTAPSSASRSAPTPPTTTSSEA